MEHTTEEVLNMLLGISEQLMRYKLKSSYFKINALSKNMLSEKQFAVLFLVRYGPCNQVSELSASLHQTVSGISILVSKLVELGFLCREYPPDNEDQRKVFFCATNEGNRALDETLLKLRSQATKLYASFTKNNQQLFWEALEYIFGNKITNMTEEQFFVFAILKTIDILSLWNMYINKEFKFNAKKNFPLSVSQVRILRFIHRFSFHCIGQLSMVLCMSESTLSATLKQLQKKSCITKMHEEKDARKALFYMTQTGQELLERADQLLLLSFQKYEQTQTDEQKKKMRKGFRCCTKCFFKLK